MSEPDIPVFLDRRPTAPFVWTYTNLHTFRDVCGHQMAEKYIYKRIPYKPTPQMDWGNKVHEAFEHRVAGGKVLPVDMQQWESFAVPFDGKGAKTELKLAVTREGKPCDYFAKDVWGRGKVDLVIMNGETAFFNDWKTGNSKYEDPFELACGAVLLRAKFPHLRKIMGVYTWLKDPRVSQPYDVSDVNATWNEIRKLCIDIENYRAAGEYPKRKGPLCKWCDVYDCENNENPERPQ